MAVREAVILAVGLGCRKGVSGEAVAALVREALRAADAPPAARGAPSCGRHSGLHLLPPPGEALEGRASPQLRLYTLADKAREPGLAEAARLLGAPLAGLPRAALEAEAARVLTPSPAARARFGLDSIAEAAALAGAGPGGRLLGPRLAAEGVTCALAVPAVAP